MDDIEAVWRRIEAHAGETFRQVRGGEFTYRVEGSSLWPDRTNRNLGKSQFAQALDRRPLTSTAKLQDLQGPSYLFAILTDPRITSVDELAPRRRKEPVESEAGAAYDQMLTSAHARQGRFPGGPRTGPKTIQRHMVEDHKVAYVDQSTEEMLSSRTTAQWEDFHRQLHLTPHPPGHAHDDSTGVVPMFDPKGS